MPKQASQFDCEHVYDEQISPLMSQIIAICQQHDIPMVASFCYASDGQGNEDLCHTALITSSRAPTTLKAGANILQQGFLSFAVATMEKINQ